MLQLSAILLYFSLTLFALVLSYRRQTSSESFLMGNRSLNYWLTAMAAHASDMSNWLFMAYPALIFMGGLFNAWAAIGLIGFMLLNWQFIAPKIRIATEKYKCLTLSSFFEKRLGDHSGGLRLFSGGICFFFYTIYIAAGLTGLGVLGENLFGISYQVGILCGITIVIAYVLIGGFVTLAWLDLFQGLFLLLVILLVPIYLIKGHGGLSGVMSSIQSHGLTDSLLPNFSALTCLSIVSLSLGWGLGYFGQPHIITKFMGIRSVHEITRSKFVGMSWMICSLGAATLIGLIGVSFFPSGLQDPEQVFIHMVQATFSPFFIGLILCAIIAATINVMSSQLLALSSILSEDFYRKLFPNQLSEKRLVHISRLGVISVALLSLAIAAGNFSSIYTLVEYAWSGLGASFGPLLIYLLYSERATRAGAWTGMITGGLASAVWPLVNPYLPVSLSALFPAFLIGLFLNWLVSQLTYKKTLASLRA